MIEKIHLKYFKQFADQSFEIDESVVLAGPNNSGKTTLLQAIATWHFAYRKWREKQGATGAARRSGLPLTRKDFLSLPTQRFNLLWTNTFTARQKDEEGGGKGAASPRIMEITLTGGSATDATDATWSHTMEFRYANSELIYAKPKDGSDLPPELDDMRVVYVPPFSGIETEEKVHTPEYQDWLIGQGKPGDIVRNLLAEASREADVWKSLTRDIAQIFNYTLLVPQYAGRPFILCEYLPGIPPKGSRGGLPKLDIASAGSGFLQTLLLLAFFYARPSTLILFDEPDAHLHVVLQEQVYERLRDIASARRCQLIISTHSEVVIDNTPPERIISFYDKPSRLLRKAQRDAVREALKRLSSMDILRAHGGRVVYTEGASDLNILRAWADVLGHARKERFDSPDALFHKAIKGSDPKEARGHFFALRVVNPAMRGVLLLDGDNRAAAEREVAADGLAILRWRRYEIENYLVHPDAIARFAAAVVGGLFAWRIVDNMARELPPAVMKAPLQDHPYLVSTAASKSILPAIFAGHDIAKGDYYKLAQQMNKAEIHPEVIEKLDIILES